MNLNYIMIPAVALNIYINQAGLHAGFSYNGLHLQRDVLEPIMGGGGYLDGLLHDLQFGSRKRPETSA